MISAASGYNSTNIQISIKQSSAGSEGGQCGPESTDDRQQDFESALSAIGGPTGDAATTLENQIKAAIQSVVQNDQSGTDTGDLRSQIHDAIDKVLKDNGIDPDQLKAALDKAHGHHHAHPSSTAGTPDDAATASDSTATDDPLLAATNSTDGTDSISSDPASDSLKKLIDQLLQSLGNGSLLDTKA